jgi:hypothetical protein
MAFPYANSIPGLLALLNQLRSNFPATVTADTLKKWSIAPNNETYVLSVIRFLGLIDDEGKKNADAGKAFLHTDDAEFQKAFADLVHTAYSGLFDLNGDASWTLERKKLVTFFRHDGDTSDLIGTRKAATFEALAEFAARRASNTAKPPQPRPAKSSSKRVSRPPSVPAAPASDSPVVTTASQRSAVSPSLTVRIEVNLPVADDQAVYDRIFKSLREHLINGG